ncbi:MAG: hypothetical protein GQF41_1251 [Candidatus Rifleibacterium amylolyticum]|nr:MAG: hypothetical protein GQF41_1251 [Candidatus Rifleibacterium amylolyticum]
MNITLFVVTMLIPVVFLLILFAWLIPISLIVSAAAAKVAVTPLDLISMRLRGTDPHSIVKAAIRLKQAGIEPEPDKPGKAPEPEEYDGDDEEMLELIRLEKEEQTPNALHILEAHRLAGGNPELLVSGLIEAKKRNIELTFKDAAAINLGDGNIVRVVAALEEARKRNVELDIKKAIQIEISSADKKRR